MILCVESPMILRCRAAQVISDYSIIIISSSLLLVEIVDSTIETVAIDVTDDDRHKATTEYFPSSNRVTSIRRS